MKAGTSVPRPELISSPCIASFVDGEAIQVSPSPAGNARTLRNRAGHTHTVPLGGARVEGLNRYLKSLRNKRKKHRKSSAKRAREKGRSRKK